MLDIGRWVGGYQWQAFKSNEGVGLKFAEIGFTKKAFINSVMRLGNFCTLGNFSKPVATIILPKLSTLLGNFCKGVKIVHFCSEIILGQLL